MQLRKVTHTLKGVRATDGAGVSLVRVLGANTTDTCDPFLMLDSFDSTDPEDYRAGFPMHPHRGIETVTFIARGAMVHEDHLGTKATVTDGEAQWLTAGSGAFHSEMPQATERLLCVQLWLNLPARDKLTAPPSYHGITRDEIREFPFEGGTLRLGAYPCVITPDTTMARCYGAGLIHERHRHRYEFNNDFRDVLQDAGLTLSGTSPDGRLVETVELTDRPFHVGVQYHPEFKSRPNKPHPLFLGFVKASLGE